MTFKLITGNVKKKKLYKEKKNLVQKFGMGYCRIVLQKERVLYCNTISVLQVGKA